VKNLERYDTIMLYVLGEVDGRHSSFAQLSVDGI